MNKKSSIFPSNFSSYVFATQRTKIVGFMRHSLFALLLAVAAPLVVTAPAHAAPGDAAAVKQDKVNINTATVEELSEKLVGIGPSKAQAIVAFRDKHGNFRTVEELEEVKGIGEATLAKNESRISL